jgi:hypothetical protein
MQPRKDGIMPHVDEGQLHAYLDGALAPSDAEYAEIHAHLASCAECRGRLAKERAIRDDASAVLARAVPRATAMPSFETLVARNAARQPASQARRAIPKVHLALAATLVLAMGAALLTTAIVRTRVAREDAALTSSARLPAASPVAPPSSAESPAVAERAPAPAAQEPAVALRAPATTPSPSSARELKTRPAEIASADKPRAGAGASAAGASARAAAPASPPAAGPPARVSELEADEARRSVAGNLSAAASGNAPLDAAALRRTDALSAMRWQKTDKEEAERRLGSRLFTVPGLALVSVEVSASSEERVVRVRQALETGGELELIERPSTVVPAAKALATQAERARKEAAPAPEQSRTPPSPAVATPAMTVREVLLQRGPLLIQARGPVSADSLRALLDRTH